MTFNNKSESTSHAGIRPQGHCQVLKKTVQSNLGANIRTPLTGGGTSGEGNVIEENAELIALGNAARRA